MVKAYKLTSTFVRTIRLFTHNLEKTHTFSESVKSLMLILRGKMNLCEKLGKPWMVFI